jgi:hypothetical protein
MVKNISWEHDKSEIGIGLQYEGPTAYFRDYPGAAGRKSKYVDPLYRHD